MAPSQKPFYIALAVVVLGGAAFITSRVMGNHAVSIPVNVVVTAGDTSGFHGYVLGSPTAPVEVTEYGDLECPSCASFSTVQFPDVKARLIDTGLMRFRYRDYPWDNLHKHPRVAAHAAACANDQGKYWEVTEAMFRQQTDYAMAANPMPVLSDIMKTAGLDLGAWHDCMKSAKYAGRIQASLDEGNKVGVTGTPSFVIGGRLYSGISSDSMVALVKSLAASAPHAAGFAAPTGGQ
jgi:protein-disulfide isomerase